MGDGAGLGRTSCTQRANRFAMQRNLAQVTYRCGFIGITIILLATIAAALTFQDPQGYPYSLLNRNISDLGKPAVSTFAWLFNGGLMLGGLFLVGFMVGLSLCAGNAVLRFVALTGVIATVAVIFVGLFPVTQFYYHRNAAMIFFIGGSLTFALFTLMILVTDQRHFARWLALPSFAATLAFALFLSLPLYLYENPLQAYVLGPPGPDRPIFWLPSLLEWLVFVSVALWVLLFSAYLYRQEKVVDC